MPREFSIVLIPGSTPADKIGNAVASLLDPHASYLEPFEPYCIPCINCVEGSEEGIKTANQQVGDFHRLWHLFQSLPANQRPAWKDYIAQWEEVAIATTLASPYLSFLLVMAMFLFPNSFYTKIVLLKAKLRLLQLASP